MRYRLVLFALGCAATVFAQGRGGRGAAGPPPTPKAAAPIDLTGYWVAVVTEDWRWRMVTPALGDYQSIPITLKAKEVGDKWDPAKDEAAGEQCRSYGAPAVMSIPGRIHITWQDDNTLKVETDAGTQTRLFHFGDWQAPNGPAGWQGDSVAQWETPRPAGRGGGGGGAAMPNNAPKTGDLKVVTTHIRPGYLRKNGVPYSDKVKLTEYWNVNTDPDGQWLILTQMVEDPEYLSEPWVLGLNFKKEADGSKWDPQACSSRW
jgi:hypothetical protein